jgi:hypothetical protein
MNIQIPVRLLQEQILYMLLDVSRSSQTVANENTALRLCNKSELCWWVFHTDMQPVIQDRDAISALDQHWVLLS